MGKNVHHKYSCIHTISLDLRGESSQAEKELRRLRMITPTTRTVKPRIVKDIAKKCAEATATRAHGQTAE